jgi:hypothetical protein
MGAAQRFGFYPHARVIMIMMTRGIVLISLLSLMVAAVPLVASSGDAMVMGCGTTCTDCHTLGKEEAIELLRGSHVVPVDARVKEISVMESVGLWKITLDVEGEKPLYIDFGKENVFVGEFFPLSQPLIAPPRTDLINAE